MKMLSIASVIFISFIFLPINAWALKPTNKSCLPYAYEKAKKHYDKGNWVVAYSYLRASLICHNHTIFKSGKKEETDFWNEIQSAMDYSWGKIHNKKVTGFSLTTPRLRENPPE